jgi:hypothetical protein
MHKKLLILFISVFLNSICSGQCKNIPIEDFQKLQIFGGSFQHAYGQLFITELYGNCFGCWIKPVFEKIKFDTTNSELTLEGHIICSNSTKSKTKDNFLFILGNIKLDTTQLKDRKEISLTIFPNETFSFFKTSEFKITTKIVDKENFLCFTTFQNSRYKSGKNTIFFPSDPATFYDVGKLINK